MHKTTFKKVSDHIKNEVHLDYACGPGTFTGIYTNSKSICVDISSKQINYGKEKYADKAEFFTLDNFNFDNYQNYFEVITVLGLLEFINEDESVELINGFYNLLKPGGRIIITVNFRSTISLLEKIQSLLTNVQYSNQFITKHNVITLEALLRDKIQSFSNSKI